MVTSMYTSYTEYLMTEDFKFMVNTNCPLLTKCTYKSQKQIEQDVHKTFPLCQIDKIHQINHKQMYGMYLLRKEEMKLNYGNVRELELYHVTTERKGIESLENGLDWRRTRRSKYGRGVSFSDDADYANFYADNRDGVASRRVIIVCSVLVSRSWRVLKNTGDNMNVPPNDMDTTVSPNGRVYVKFNDYEFYPRFLVYYVRPDLQLSHYCNNKNRINIVRMERELQEQQEEQRLREQEQQRLRKLKLQHQENQEVEKWRRQQQRELLKYQQLLENQKRNQNNWQQRLRGEQIERERLNREDNSCLIL